MDTATSLSQASIHYLFCSVMKLPAVSCQTSSLGENEFPSFLTSLFLSLRKIKVLFVCKIKQTLPYSGVGSLRGSVDPRYNVTSNLIWLGKKMSPLEERGWRPRLDEGKLIWGTLLRRWGSRRPGFKGLLLILFLWPWCSWLVELQKWVSEKWSDLPKITNYLLVELVEFCFRWRGQKSYIKGSES